MNHTVLRNAVRDAMRAGDSFHRPTTLTFSTTVEPTSTGEVILASIDGQALIGQSLGRVAGRCTARIQVSAVIAYLDRVGEGF